MFFPLDSIADTLANYNDLINTNGYVYSSKDIFCKKCKRSLSDFLDTGFVGCAECYNSFKNQALELARDYHGRLKHVGKVPRAEVTKSAKKRELERLMREKDEAAKREDYIRANELKMQIERLREEIDGRR